MPMRDRLARLVQRSPARLTIRERAASLKVSAAKVMHKRPSMPEPNSEEAKAAFKTACTLSDKLAHAAVHGYPELNRPDGSCWTRDSLWKALEAGELPAAEVAPLYRLAAERELRIDAAAVRANVGALHVLAFADSWPLPNEEAEGDPAFSEIETHRASWAQMDKVCREHGNLHVSDPRHIALTPLVDASFAEEERAADALLSGGATTFAGLLALARYLPKAMQKDAEDGARCLRALGLLSSSLLVLAEQGQIREVPDETAERCAELATIHPGFVAYPFDKPAGVLRLDYAIRNEAQRLLNLAQAEMQRREALYEEHPQSRPWHEIRDDLRAELRCDALKWAADPAAFPTRPPKPDFTGYSISDLYTTFRALRVIDETVFLATRSLEKDSIGDGVLDSLSHWIGFMSGFVANEMKTRKADKTPDIYQRSDALITWAVACGSYDEAAEYCEEKHASELAQVAKFKEASRG